MRLSWDYLALCHRSNNCNVILSALPFQTDFIEKMKDRSEGSVFRLYFVIKRYLLQLVPITENHNYLLRIIIICHSCTDDKQWSVLLHKPSDTRLVVGSSRPKILEKLSNSSHLEVLELICHTCSRKESLWCHFSMSSVNVIVKNNCTGTSYGCNLTALQISTFPDK